MLASEYIRRLEVLIGENGDAECEDEEGELISEPEFNNDTGTPAYILARLA